MPDAASRTMTEPEDVSRLLAEMRMGVCGCEDCDLLERAAVVIERFKDALEILAYRGTAAVAAYNSPEGIPLPSKAVMEVAREALDGRT